jgi:hypothetical protein
MFGTLKENILSKLEKTYTENGENVFKKEFNRYIETIKESKDLKEFYEVYDLFKQVNFDDKDVAKEFIEESISYLKTFDKNQINKLTVLVDKIEKINENTIEYKLDQIIFNENISLNTKAQIKVDLIKQITKKDNLEINYKESFDTLHNKINESVSKLNEEQTKALELFIENDSEKIKSFYDELINETQDIVENKIIESENLDVIKKLVEVKKRLSTLKNEKVNINEIEKILALKESLN